MNPILPLTEYVPDGEPHVFGSRVYLYGSHDKAPYCTDRNIFCFCILLCKQEINTSHHTDCIHH